MKNNCNHMHVCLVIVSCFMFFGARDTYSKDKTPAWFNNLPHKEYEIVGYGMSNERLIAISKARREVAQSIITRIQSESLVREEMINAKYTQEVRTVLRENTDVILTDVLVVKEELYDNNWFVAVKYENIPLENKIKKGCGLAGAIDEHQNRYITQTPLGRRLNRALGKEMNFQLLRKNGLWYVFRENCIYHLDPNDFEKLFINCQIGSVEVTTKNINLQEGESFCVKLHAKDDGYITLLNICEDGEVFILCENIPIERESTITFPPKESAEELFAGIQIKGTSTYDLIVALWSKEKMNNSRLQKASDKMGKAETNFKFDEVMELMDRYDFCSMVLRTHPIQFAPTH